jgi:hypothetical protein
MLTLRDIISNIKKGQTAVSVRFILDGLESYYVNHQDSIALAGCKSSATYTTIFLTIPSESTKNVNYDIVLQVMTKDKMTLDTKFKVYSNSPSFAYNFSYVFNRNGSLLYPEKYPKEFREIPPKTRNPFMTAGFDKHVFSGIRYISDYKIKRIIGEMDNRIPPIKSFQEKVREIENIQEDLRRSQLGRS